MDEVASHSLKPWIKRNISLLLVLLEKTTSKSLSSSVLATLFKSTSHNGCVSIIVFIVYVYSLCIKHISVLITGVCFYISQATYRLNIKQKWSHNAMQEKSTINHIYTLSRRSAIAFSSTGKISYNANILVSLIPHSLNQS